MRTVVPYCPGETNDTQGWDGTYPGGIVRFKETLETRIKKVAETEIGADLSYDPIPIDIHQLIHPGENDSRAFNFTLISMFS